VFVQDGVVYRQVNESYRGEYECLVRSGLYDALAGRGLLIQHEEVPTAAPADRRAYKILRPRQLPFVSYPYEWCFSQLADAARTTLLMQRIALAHGMCLKDASAYNIQFLDGRPVHIDTLSFERYEPGRPWVAYRQFCQQFLAPLALMSTVDVRLGQLSRICLDGVPLELASRLLPLRTLGRLSLSSHIHLHARAGRRFADRRIGETRRRMSLTALRGLIDNLSAAIERLSPRSTRTGWTQYEESTTYSAAARAGKERLVRALLQQTRPGVVWDLGANTGRFSRAAADGGAFTVALDADHDATELHYRTCRAAGQPRVLPLVVDLVNPSPGIGWAHAERASLAARGPADVVLALALVHHLAIGNNLPFERIADVLHDLGRCAIVEYIPKHDAGAQRLLANREDHFDDYSEPAFERAFRRRFEICQRVPIPETTRVLYLMRRTTP
jgi:ribosomal protein L11 methylase PrmA